MEPQEEFEGYLGHVCEALGHRDRHAPLKDDCRGPMLPIERKSIEPLAAHTAPLQVQAKHQSLHRFVAKSSWSDAAVLERVRQWVMPWLGLEDGCYWIVDDSGHPKQGKHSVGVGHQYCGQLGKTANCQMAVSLSLASARGSVPIDYRLYLPREWAEDAVRRQTCGVPEGVEFATKPRIALAQMRAACQAGVAPGVVLADAAYGDETGFRDGITELGLPYVVGVRPATTVWTRDILPLPPKPWSGRGAKPILLRTGTGHEPVAVKALAMSGALRYEQVTWRDGSNAARSSRFACLRVHAAHRTHLSATLRAEEWLLVEWPEGDTEPTRYWLSTAPADATLEQLVFVAKMRWRIERDYEDLKQEFGLSHYEGRNWTGFHHHATLCIAAYAFSMYRRLRRHDAKKNGSRPEAPALPEDDVPRGRPTRTTPRTGFDPNPAPAHRARHRSGTGSLPLLRTGKG
jgi:SRSO17 transposase